MLRCMAFESIPWSREPNLPRHHSFFDLALRGSYLVPEKLRHGLGSSVHGFVKPA